MKLTNVKRYSLRLRSTWRSQRSWNHFIIVVYRMLNKDKLMAASAKWNVPWRNDIR